MSYWANQLEVTYDGDVGAFEQALDDLEASIPAVETFYAMTVDKFASDEDGYKKLGRLSYWAQYMRNELGGSVTELNSLLSDMSDVKDSASMLTFYGKTAIDVDDPTDMGLVSYWTTFMRDSGWGISELNAFFDDMNYVKTQLTAYFPSLNINNPKDSGLVSYWTGFYRENGETAFLDAISEEYGS
jgi:hypothetical protein